MTIPKFKIDRNAAIVVVVVLIFSLYSLISRKPNPSPATINQNLPTTNPEISPTPTPISAIKVTSVFPPHKSTPPITNLLSAITVTFSSALSNDQIKDLKIECSPDMSFKTVINVNKQTVYFTPLQRWQNQTYAIAIKLSGKIISQTSFTSTAVASSKEGENNQVPDQSQFPLPKKH